MLWRETRDDPDLRRRAFIGLRRYQEATRPAPPPAPAIFAAAGQARLLHFAGDAGDAGRAPVVCIPSLINPPRVLDLSRERSLLRHLTANGHDAYLVDWGSPGADDSGLDLSAHVTERLIPLLDALSRPPILVGYCLGGTLALGCAAAASARGVATIAAPWHFDGFPAADRDQIAALWRNAKPTCERLGYVPMEILQSGFWALDPRRTVAKYAAFADMAEGSPQHDAFLAVEDWANEGAPLTFAAARQLFDDFYARDMTGAGRWQVGGVAVNPAALPCPTLSVRSSTDRIVPAEASPKLADTRTLALGHVGMIVSGRARDALWRPLSDFLSRAGG
ncbi:MAG: alpha/beta fold hydrolase [Sphingobium sp.]|nr:alpha/beta fold hydrolase [Sphingobium sp.]